MTKRMEIVMKGRRVMDGERENIEMYAQGDHYIRDGKHYILYEEVTEEKKAIRNVVKISSDCLEIVKKGEIQSRMVFRENETTGTSYVTPVGQLAVGIRTSRLEVRETEDGLEVLTEYAMEMNGRHLSDTSLTITVRCQESCENEFC